MKLALLPKSHNFFLNCHCTGGSCILLAPIGPLAIVPTCHVSGAAAHLCLHLIKWVSHPLLGPRRAAYLGCKMKARSGRHFPKYVPRDNNRYFFPMVVVVRGSNKCAGLNKVEQLSLLQDFSDV